MQTKLFEFGALYGDSMIHSGLIPCLELAVQDASVPVRQQVLQLVGRGEWLCVRIFLLLYSAVESDLCLLSFYFVCLLALCELPCAQHFNRLLSVLDHATAADLITTHEKGAVLTFESCCLSASLLTRSLLSVHCRHSACAVLRRATSAAASGGAGSEGSA